MMCVTPWGRLLVCAGPSDPAEAGWRAGRRLRAYLTVEKEER